MSLSRKTIQASIWSSLAEIIAKIINPLVFLLLTQILSPKDFGVVAVATTVLGFIYVISDMGTSKILIQYNNKSKDFDKLCDVSFWFNSFMGIILFLLVFILAPQIANLYNQPNSSLVIRVLSLQILFYSLSSVQNALRKRELDFKFLFIVRLITIGTPLFISLPIAFAGGGYWAIVFSSLVGSALSMIVLWVKSNWKPTKYFNFSLLKNIFSKSAWSTTEQIFIWIPISLDTYLLSNFLSTSDLGYFSTSKTFFATVTGLFLAPFIPVLFSALSKLTEETARFRRSVLFAQKLVFSISGFIGTSVFIYREYIGDLIFNQNWKGISAILGLMFLIMGLEYFYSVIVESLRACGYFKQVAINTVICICISAPILYFSVSKGLVIYVIVRSLLLYIQYPGIFYLSKIKNSITFTNCLSNVKICIILLSFYLVIGFIIEYYISGYWNRFFLLFSLSLFTFGLYLMIERNLFLSVVKTILKK